MTLNTVKDIISFKFMINPEARPELYEAYIREFGRPQLRYDSGNGAILAASAYPPAFPISALLRIPIKEG